MNSALRTIPVFLVVPLLQLRPRRLRTKEKKKKKGGGGGVGVARKFIGKMQCSIVKVRWHTSAQGAKARKRITSLTRSLKGRCSKRLASFHQPGTASSKFLSTSHGIVETTSKGRKKRRRERKKNQRKKENHPFPSSFVLHS